jgi:tRNA(Ile)-lysidine synthase
VSTIVRTVRQFIEKHQLLSPADTVLVALSGGSDSVALLHILHHLKYQCIAAHCNFSLRGEESDRDEAFVCRLCTSLSVPLEVIRFDTHRYAAEHHQSIEMAARELRYNWFEEMIDKHHAAAVAVAHHRDDSVETMLLNLVRGTGIQGLCGMRPLNGHVIRPLLCVSRNDIIDYLSFLGQSYVTDSTNLQDEFTRNKIRLRVLPLLEEINPSVKESLQRTSQYLSEVDHIYNKEIVEGKLRVMREGDISISALMAEPSPYALLFEILHPLSFNSSQIDDIFNALDGISGKVFISDTCSVVKDRDMLLVRKRDADTSQPPFEIEYEECEYTSDFVIPRTTDRVCFDADKLDAPLTLRKCVDGDRFVPFGMKGSKLVSNFLTDMKLSVVDKKNQWLLCSGERIVWVVGRRTDDRFRLDSSTKKVIIAVLKEKK